MKEEGSAPRLGAKKVIHIKDRAQFEGLHFLANDYFAAPENPGDHATETKFVVYRTSDAQQMCVLHGDFKFVRNTTNLNYLADRVMGILDVKTGRISSVS